MADMSAIAAALSSFNAAKDIAQSMVGLRDAAAFQSKLIEFQSKILDAQNSAFAANEERTALIERVRELEKRVIELEGWEAEKQKYKLVDVVDGVMAYAPKETMEGAEVSHYLCANCYADGKKSVLQPEMRNPGRALVLVCHRCGSELYKVGSWEPEHGKTTRGR